MFCVVLVYNVFVGVIPERLVVIMGDFNSVDDFVGSLMDRQLSDLEKFVNGVNGVVGDGDKKLVLGVFMVAGDGVGVVAGRGSGLDDFVCDVDLLGVVGDYISSCAAYSCFGDIVDFMQFYLGSVFNDLFTVVVVDCFDDLLGVCDGPGSVFILLNSGGE